MSRHSRPLRRMAMGGLRTGEVRAVSLNRRPASVAERGRSWYAGPWTATARNKTGMAVAGTEEKSALNGGGGGARGERGGVLENRVASGLEEVDGPPLH